MRTNAHNPWLAASLVLAMVLSVAPFATADHRHSGEHDTTLIRRTIPDPHAVKRSPLTSDRLSTTSTRYIDARRGFRPYSSVFGDCPTHQRYAAHDDHFGISRPENRPWSYSQRTARSYVSQFRNDRTEQTTPPAAPRMPLVVREQSREDKPEVDMRIRIHNDRTAVPTTTGAVLITSDGTVIQVGD